MQYQFQDLDEYQRHASKFAVYTDNIYPVLGLAEEAGEVAGKFAKHRRGDKPLDLAAVRKELGDVLWMVAMVCMDNGITLSSVAQENIHKLEDRQARNKIQGEGDNR